jgi:GH24 family phage-related lysozyme (muramidase)
MYRCTGGEVTVGVGHALLTPADAPQLSWNIAGQPATASQILADYTAIQNAQMGLAASKYAPMTTCRIDEGQIAQLLNADVLKFESQLRQHISDWDGLPGPVQEALFDMAFNLGIGGLLTKFPKLLQAVKNRKWQDACAECHRSGIQDARNEAIKQLFLEAAKLPANPR